MKPKTHFIKGESLDIFKDKYTVVLDSRDDSLIRYIINKDDIIIKSDGEIKPCDVVVFIITDRGQLTGKGITIDYNYMVGENDNISLLLKHK